MRTGLFRAHEPDPMFPVDWELSRASAGGAGGPRCPVRPRTARTVADEADDERPQKSPGERFRIVQLERKSST